MTLPHLVDGKLAVEAFVTLAVIMDPPGTLPLFLSLTGGSAPRERKRMATTAVVVSFSVITAFAVFGQTLLTYLGISVPALQAAGGLLLLLVSLELLTGRAEEPTVNQDVNVAMVPLGTPLLAGPGAIVATMVFVRRAHDDPAAIAAVAIGIVAVHLLLWVLLRYSSLVLRLLKDSGVTLVTRIAGLLLAAIAVQMVADAVIAYTKLA